MKQISVNKTSEDLLAIARRLWLKNENLLNCLVKETDCSVHLYNQKIIILLTDWNIQITD